MPVKSAVNLFFYTRYFGTWNIYFIWQKKIYSSIWFNQ